MTGPIKITKATDLLEVVPALLGFYPTESLCVLALDYTADGGSRLMLTARADLPTNPAELTGAAAMLTQMLSRYDRVALVAYSLDTTEARTALQHLLSRIDPDRVVTAVLAGPNGWTHLDPAQPDTVQWTNPYPTATGPAAQAAAQAGLAAYGTRDDLTDSIAAPDPASTTAFEHAYAAQDVPTQPTPAQLRRISRDVTDYLNGYLSAPATVTTDDAAWLVASLQHVTVRDTAWAHITSATARNHAALWRGVAALTPDVPAVLPVLGLVGMAGWISGDGALANVALDRADHIPGRATYTMLDLLQTVLDQMLPPTLWDAMADQIRRELDL